MIKYPVQSFGAGAELTRRVASVFIAGEFSECCGAGLESGAGKCSKNWMEDDERGGGLNDDERDGGLEKPKISDRIYE